MDLTSRYLDYLLKLGVRDALAVQIAFVAVCLAGVYWLAIRGSRRPEWWLAAAIGAFYVSLIGYWLVGQI